MNIHHRTIHLVAPPQTRCVKWLALNVFSGVRNATATLTQLPVLTHLIVQDIIEAWQESASPKP